MSRARQRRQVIRWARYFNHYGHIEGVLVGGHAAHRTVGVAWADRFDCFLFVRRQANHRYGERRAS